MGIHVLLQFFVVIFVINPLLLAVFYNSGNALRLGRINAVFLFVIALTQYSYFKKQSLIAGRILFTPAIFFLLSIGVGLTVLFITREAGEAYSGAAQRVLAVGAGMLFYVVSAAVFSLYETPSVRQVPIVRFLGGFVVVGIVVRGTSGLIRTVSTTDREKTHPVRTYTTLRTTIGNSAQGIGVAWKAMNEGITAEWKRIFAVTHQNQLRLSDEEKERLVALLQTGDGTGANEANVPPQDGDNQPETQPTGESLTDLLIIPDSDILESASGAQTEPVGTGVVSVGNDTANGRLFEEASDLSGPLTYGSFLPILVDEFGLTAPATAQYGFTTIAASDPRYEAFRIARYRTMIGTSTSPDTQMRCGNLMVLIGLADNRDVQQGNVIQAYRQVAVERGYTANGCETTETLATRAMVP